MPAIPESLPEGALSLYDALADVDKHAASRGVSAWGEEGGEEKGAAKTRAGDWLNGLPWRGSRAEKEQKDAWGRVGVKDDDGFTWEADELPPAVLTAFCEMCFVFLAVGMGKLPDPTAPVSERELSVTSETIDVLEFQYGEAFSSPLVRDSITGFPIVDALLAGFLRRNSRYGGVEVHRG